MSAIPWTAPPPPDCDVIDALAYVLGTTRVENLMGVSACSGARQKVRLRGASYNRRTLPRGAMLGPAREFELCASHRELPPIREAVLGPSGR
jgi:hypothetical protein